MQTAVSSAGQRGTERGRVLRFQNGEEEPGLKRILHEALGRKLTHARLYKRHMFTRQAEGINSCRKREHQLKNHIFKTSTVSETDNTVQYVSGRRQNIHFRLTPLL